MSKTVIFFLCFHFLHFPATLDQSESLVVCEVDDDLVKKLREFRFRKATNNAAIISESLTAFFYIFPDNVSPAFLNWAIKIEFFGFHMGPFDTDCKTLCGLFQMKSKVINTVRLLILNWSKSYSSCCSVWAQERTTSYLRAQQAACIKPELKLYLLPSLDQNVKWD